MNKKIRALIEEIKAKNEQAKSFLDGESKNMMKSKYLSLNLKQKRKHLKMIKLQRVRNLTNTKAKKEKEQTQQRSSQMTLNFLQQKNCQRV